VGTLMFASRFKRWLLAERIEQLQISYEPAGAEHQQPQDEPVREGTMTQEPVVAARGVIRGKRYPFWPTMAPPTPSSTSGSPTASASS
jgi:hypothetical protein